VSIRALQISFLVLHLASVALVSAAEEEVDQDQRLYVSIGSGFDFSRGDYGEEDANGNSVTTNVASVPFFTKIEWEPITFRASIPVLYIDGSDQVTAEGPQTTGAIETRRTFGVGDLTTSLAYTYYPDHESVLPIVDFIVKVRIHSSTPDDLGASGTSVSVGTELSKSFGRFSVFSGVSRRFNTGKDFDDVWLATVGGAVRFVDWLSVGAAYDFRQASTTASSDSHEVSPYASLRLSEHVRLTPYGVIGLSNGSPDWGVGSSVSYEF